MPLENSAHRFALDRAVARVNAYDDLPRARHPRSHASVTMRPTDFCQPLCFLNLYPCSLFPTLLRPARIFRSVRCDRRVRRFTTRWTRFGGPCGNEEGFSPSRAALRLHPVALTLVVSLRSRLHL